ncbi:AsmA protein [Vibrio ichthyoenteri ATCC 700023]|uniref:AsmA protein n=1 Tax=Vibrio ichthyoenteri ATCC 700023 TaxID=870968 RepID=F9S2T5_9VIBR|nr:AsmA family protein [Vibrio ichthyoenteri]EGU38859.1 AsmA protein [Vibrio ichthyoenteri ATCC 700023]
MKKLALIIAIPVVAILAVVLALVLLVNPNQFKPLIVEQAKQQTGLDLVIEGDISWQFFPSVGFTLGQTELKNPQGFTQPNLFKVSQVGVDVSVIPLFSQQLDIGQITLDGAEFYLETRKDGVKNIDALTQQQAQEAVAESSQKEPESANTNSDPAASSSTANNWTISLAGVAITNALLDIQDDQTGSHTKLYDVSLTLSEFAFGQWSKADFAAKGETNLQKFTAKGTAELNLAKGFAQYALRNIAFDASYNDANNQIDEAKIELATFEFDKPNALKYAVKGTAAELGLNLKGSAQLVVDKAISTVAMNQLILDANFEGASLPQSPMKVDMTSDLSFDLTKSHLSFVLEKLTANALQFDGQLDVTLADIPKIVFNLHSPNIDVDAFLAQDGSEQTAANSESDSKPAAEKSATPAATTTEQEPDLSALKTLDVTGAITIDKFKAANAKMQNVAAKFSVNRGVVKLTSFSSNLYDGSIKATATLDARKSPASYTAQKFIKGVKVQPLLIDVADNDKLEGTGNIDVDVRGSSLTPMGMKKNLVGTIKINFADGAVNGLNVAQLIRENYAKFKGQSLEGQDVAKKTDFSAMTATLTLNKGVVTTDNLHAQSPLLRVRGEGSANYIKETVDFTISTSIVGSLEGQGGKDIDELKDLTIPVNVSGSWSQPKFKLVFDDVLKQKAEKEIDRGLKKLDEKLGDKIKDEKTKEAVNSLIKGLFN